MTFDAVVLAGGAARRLGGRDKPAVRVGGRALLDRVLDATVAAGTTVVVGPARETARPVVWTREDPPGAGPAAALAAGLAHVSAPVAVLLAADLPFLTPAVVELLAGAARGRGVVVVDDGGGEQWLCSAWPTALLRTVRLAAGTSLRATLGPLPRVPVTLPPGARPAWFDCDTPGDITTAEERLA